MSEVPEHVKITLPYLVTLDKRIDELEDQARSLRAERQKHIDAEAQKIAKFKVGDELDKRKGRYRITKVGGDYYDGNLSETGPIIWVCYYGCQLFKKGTEGRVEKLHMPWARAGSNTDRVSEFDR